MIKKAVIICGGLATRMLPITKAVSKEMLPILSKPAIDYCVSDLKANGITDILIILGRNKENLEEYFDRNIELEYKLAKKDETTQNSISNMYQGINLYFIRQIFAKGTGYAVYKAKNFVNNEPFVLMYPDELMIEQSFTKLLVDEYNKTKKCIIPIKKVPITESEKYGMLDFQETNKGIKIKKIVEKPKPKESPSDMCYTGGGVFTPQIFDYLEKCETHSNGEIYLTDAFEGLAQNDNLYGAELKGIRLDIGTPLGFLKANVLVGLTDEKIKDELLEFLKTVVRDNIE